MIAIIFPGQGSQYVGMGKDFYEKFPLAQELFHQANSVLNLDLSTLCFQGPPQKINETTITQPAVFSVSVICWEILKKFGLRANVFAGHSLGEYTALFAAQALDFVAALRLVERRAFFMQDGISQEEVMMAAIIGLSQEETEKCCWESFNKGIVEIANINSEDQIVISGEKKAVDAAANLCKSKGAKKVVLLDVSVPSHSSLMKKAAEKFSNEVARAGFRKPLAKVVANTTADYYKDEHEIKNELTKQLYSRVLWKDSIKRMLNDGITTFVEVGPGRVLSGLVRRIDRNVNILNVEDTESLKRTLEMVEKKPETRA